MKKLFIAIISSFLAIMPMPVFAEDSQVTTLKYVVSAKVRYVTDNTTMDIADVQCGDTLKEPDNPQKDGYKFIGWQDEETGKFWDFNDAVERNMTLIARFEKISDKVPDKEEITSPETKKDTETVKSDINTGVQNNNAVFVGGICIAFAGIGFATYKLLKKDEKID